MDKEKIFHMPFSKVFGLLVAKVERKGRSREEVIRVTSWLTGYSDQEIEAFEKSDICYGDFFSSAPMMNPARKNIKGVVCGIRVEDIEDDLMRDIRYLDKMVDERAKGKAMEKILRS